MGYILLEKYRYAWFFYHKELLIAESELKAIKPLDSVSSHQIWHQLISKNANHPEFFDKSEWVGQPTTWHETGDWQAAWDSDDSSLPPLINEQVQWEGNTIVFFCYNNENIIETTWDVFTKNWKNFLFLDDGPILVGKRRKEVIQFQQNGQFLLGKKP